MGLAGPCDLTESFIWPLGKKRDPYNSSHSVQYVKCRWESSQMGPYDTEKKGVTNTRLVVNTLG